MTGPGARRVPVPDGLDGERLDAALARMFGLSRSAAAELISAGDVLVDGRPAVKSDRVPAGEWLDVTLPPPPVPLQARPEAVPGMTIVHEDDDIIVVDKPAGVAAHPTPGWTGPTVLQGLLAAGHTIATSGAAERQGIVHRLDANTTGLMAVAKSERAYSTLKQAFRDREVDKLYGADPVLAARLGLNRQWLHAVQLGFAHPADGRCVQFRSEYPADLRSVLDVLTAES
jgi:23S rRNA pseudouridine1911/1915/1917 synthase